jgi:large subunit ribosomal protein L31
MKASIHPAWFPQAKIVCACGNTFVSGSTLPEIHVEICSNCHPLYTGQQRFVDTLGQVDRFVKKVQESKVKQQERSKILEARRSKTGEQKRERLTLKELLMKARKQATS